MSCLIPSFPSSFSGPGLVLAVLFLSTFLSACGPGSGEAPDATEGAAGADADAAVDPLAAMNDIAPSYTRLVLALGEHDEHYVDAYYGPEEWPSQIEGENLGLGLIRRRALELRERLEGLPTEGLAELPARRHRFLYRQLEGLLGRVDMLEGKTLSFDEESRVLYDAVAPSHDPETFLEAQEKLKERLPGEGSLVDRLKAFRDGFVIPEDRLDAVFQRAIEACRERTEAHLELPEGESFVVEYVKDQPWSAYNWYQGGYKSLIQVNTDLPIYIDRAIDLACHEGYPGHHVYNALLEKNLVRDRGWVEFSVYPLFSPQSLIAEGTANYGIEVAFPGDERIEFEQRELFPLAGLDPATADDYYAVLELLKGLGYAGNEAARAYLNGEIDADEAGQWLSQYALSPLDRAQQRVRFFDRYRSYVINYNLGQDLVEDYVVRQGGTEENPERRWEVFTDLLSMPWLPSELVR